MNDEALFYEALNVSTTERAAFLAKACADDAQRQRIERLLEAHETPASFLQSPPAELDTTAMTGERSPAAQAMSVHETVPEGPGSRIGPYKLLQQIGEGGMGVVYMAEQSEPVHRIVALKIIRPDLDSRHVIARMEAERQALALMDHPNIAHVLDAGATASGRPFFVMELVKGVPITEYCDAHRLTPRQRLELFIPVCQAVQHAHQKGIIHRDIKPSNVLVALYDGRPVPKVIDFGVAKATGSRLTNRTLFTEFGAIIGTLEYMSPEQAQLNQLDIDTRSDVYSLGVLLYELLTGTTPLNRKELGEKALLETLRIIREQDPPTPSTRLSTTAGLPSIAANRGLEPRRLSGLVRGELDWIVMKALEKDRARRYETANGLLRDVQRYLADEPVDACPPSAAYRVRKFASKNRRLLLTAAAFAALLLIAAMVSIVLAIRATDARDDEVAARIAADADRNKAVAAEGRAKASEEAARIEAAISQAVSKFVTEDLLEQVDAWIQANPDPDVKVVTLLDRAAESVERRFGDQPLVEASIRMTIGNAYRAIGNYTKAMPHLERALALRQKLLGEEDVQTLTAVNALAYLYWEAKLNQQASQVMLDSALRMSRRVLGNDHPLTLTLIHNVAVSGHRPDAAALYEEALAGRRRVLGPDHFDTVRTLHNTATEALNHQQYAKADELYVEVLSTLQRLRGDDNGMTILCRGNLAAVRWKRGNVKAAEPLFIDALERSRRVLGREHRITRHIRKNLLEMYEQQRDYAKAEPLAVEVALEMTRPQATSDLNLVLSNRLAEIYVAEGGLSLMDQKRYEEAEPILRLLVREEFPQPWLHAHTRSLLGEALAGQKKFAEAEPMLLDALELLKAGEKSIPVSKRKIIIDATSRVVRLYEDWAKPAQAQEWKASLAAETTRHAKRVEAVAHFDRGVKAAASRQAAPAITAFKEAIAAEPNFAEAHNALGEVLCYQKADFAAAIGAFQEAIKADPANAAARCNLSNTLYRSGQTEEAIAAYRASIPFQPLLENALNDLRWEGQQLQAARDRLKNSPDDPAAMLDMAFVLHFVLKNVSAEEAFRKVLAIQPGHALAYHGLARALTAQQKYEQAIETYRKAIETNPSDTDSHVQMGQLLRQARRYPEAEAAFREALRQRPDWPGAAGYLDQVLRAQEKPDLIVELQERVRVAPADAAALVAFGYAYLSRNQPQDAQWYFRKALQVQPKLADAHVGLGVAFLRLDRRLFKQSVAAFREALRLQPDHYAAAHQLATTLVVHDWPEAEPMLTEAIKQQPNDAEFRYLLAEGLLANNRKDEAVAVHSKAVELDPGFRRRRIGLIKLTTDGPLPDDPDLNQRLSGVFWGHGVTFRQSQLLGQAEAAQREALRLHPANAEPHYELAQLLALRRDPGAAVTAMREAVRLKPDDTAKLIYLARLLAWANQDEECERAFRDLIRLRPDSGDAHMGLGELLARRNRLEEAEASYREVLRLHPKDPRIHILLGDVLSRRGQLEEAKKVYLELIRLQPTEGSHRILLADLLMKMSRPDDAAAAYAEAVRIDPGLKQRVDRAAATARQLAKQSPEEKALREKVAKNPGDIKALTELGMMLNTLIRSEEAEQIGRRAVALAPGDGAANDVLIRALIPQYRLREAESLCREFLRATPDEFRIQLSLGEVLFSGGDWAAAEPVLREAMSKQPGNLVARALLSRTLLKLGKAVEAEEVCRESVVRAPTSSYTKLRLGDALLAQAKLADARAAYEDALRLEPKLSLAQRGIDQVVAIGQLDADVARCLSQLEQKPDDRQLLAEIGDLYARRCRWDQAQAALAKAVQVSPEDHLTRIRYIAATCYAGKMSDYRLACGELIRRYYEDRRPEMAERNAKACFLAPDESGIELAVLQQLVDRAVTGNEQHGLYWFFKVLKALAEYRAGRYAEALQWVAKATGGSVHIQTEVILLSVRAMSEFRLGRVEDAHTSLAKARQLLNQMPDERLGQPLGSDWHDWLQAAIVFREAEKLLKPQP